MRAVLKRKTKQTIHVNESGISAHVLLAEFLSFAPVWICSIITQLSLFPFAAMRGLELEPSLCYEFAHVYHTWQFFHSLSYSL